MVYTSLKGPRIGIVGQGSVREWHTGVAVIKKALEAPQRRQIGQAAEDRADAVFQNRKWL